MVLMFSSDMPHGDDERKMDHVRNSGLQPNGHWIYPNLSSNGS